MQNATRQVQPVGPRVLHLVLAGVMAIAFVGFFVGTRHVHTPLLVEPPPPGAHDDLDHDGIVFPAMRYQDLRGERLSPNRNWTHMLADLDQPPFDAWVPPDEDARRELGALRATRRAHPGAPPVVPHAIDQMTSMNCMACHGEGLRLAGGRIATKMPHEFLPNCTQCHVEMQAIDLEPNILVENRFMPLDSPLAGERAWPGAPPTIPHPTFMRSDCMACHGEIAYEPLRTSHPWQTNCIQCHAASSALDQVARELPKFLSPPEVIEP